MAVKTQKINQRKTEAVQKVKQQLESARDVLFTDFRGLNVSQISELRKALRDTETDYRVVKNAYTKIALQEMGFPDVSEYLFGPTALALVKRDVGPVAKAIIDFSRNSTVQMKGGIIGGRVFSFEEVKALSELPGRDQLLAMLMRTMNAPVQKFVFGLNAVVQKLVLTIKAVGDQKAAEESK